MELRMNDDLTPEDLVELGRQGIGEDEARAQLRALRRGPRGVELVRPCTIGDGLLRIPEEDVASLVALHDRAAAEGRWCRFLPASGAGTRITELPQGDELGRIGSNLTRFAFAPELDALCRRRGDSLPAIVARGEGGELVRLLLDDSGLGYASLPKALWEFHRYGDFARTALEEHLREAAATLRDRNHVCRLCLTILPAHQAAFSAVLPDLQQRLARELAVRWEMALSLQSPSTHTLSLDAADQPWRNDRGELILRPGGHGALLENLDRLQANLVFVKNIDNVAHEQRQAAGRHWTRLLGGQLVRLQQAANDHLDALARQPGSNTLDAAKAFLSASFCQGTPDAWLGWEPAMRREWLIDRLRRPLRVCGMVRNEGEPGGSPCWIRGADGTESLQVVEKSEVRLSDPAQQARFSACTHFNPVFLALALRDHQGQPFALRDFADPERTMVASKVELGQAITVLERPGLWNGGMARWNTCFVEVPRAVFTPVKRLGDLLRPEHQPTEA